MKRKILLLCCFLLLLLVNGCGQKELIKSSDTRFVMDTFLKIDAYSEDPRQTRLALDDAMQTFQQIATISDRYYDGGADSLFAINQNAGKKAVVINKLLVPLFTFATQHKTPEVDITIGPLVTLWQNYKEIGDIPNDTEIHKLLPQIGSNKVLFDNAQRTVFLPDSQTSLDLGAVAKGYAVDTATSVLQKHNITSALINAGGNIKVIGKKPNGDNWLVAVQHPRNPEAFLGTVALLPGQAASTSGDYQRYYEVSGQRYHHLLLPATGKPTYYHQAVTVIANSALEADYTSTLFFLMPTPDIQTYLSAQPNLAAIIVEPNGSLIVSDNLAKVWQPVT